MEEPYHIYPDHVKPPSTMMSMPYAHAVIDASDGTRYERGDEVDESKFEDDELQDLRDGGAIQDEDYDESVDVVGPPDVVVIDGVEYVKASDGAKEDTDARV